MRALAILLVVVAAAPARAQAPEPAEERRPDEAGPVQFDPTTCKKQRRRGTPQTEATVTELPTTWKDFQITGDFVDPPAVVRELMAPTLERHRALTQDARDEIEATAQSFGYHVVGLGTRETPAGTIATVHVAPQPMVRRVSVDIKQSWLSTLLSDEVRRRMRVRPGAYLPWPPDERNCVLHEEARRIQEYLHDEGYFDAAVKVRESIDGVGVTLQVDVALGPEYRVDTDKIFIPDADRLPIDPDEIKDKFVHGATCLLGYCFGTSRFRRASYELDKQAVIDLFRKRGFPAVSVRISEPMPDRRTRRVEFAITIDPRRQVDVRFEGAISGSTDALRKQLTFDKAASFDDLEKNESARAIAAYLQSRGYFDARVTWYRPSTQQDPTSSVDEQPYEPLVFQIHQGPQRTVRSVTFTGNRAIDGDTLAAAVETKPARLSSSLLGTTSYATSAGLASDVERLVTLYRRRGYRDVRVRVNASTDPAALPSAALTAALVSSDKGSGLHVRFAIEEGLPTLLAQLHVELGDKGTSITTPEAGALCAQVLKDLAELYATPAFARPVSSGHCIAVAPNLPFREEDVAATRDQIKDRLFSRGRPRAQVTLEPVPIEPRRMAVHYRLRDTQQLTIGKVVIRGNFRTRDSIILRELRLREGAPLTSDALAEGTRRLRNTALFESVNVKLPDLDNTSAGQINAVVEVTERYDYFAAMDVELGASTFNGLFLKVIPALKNLFGTGISLDVAVTGGLDINELAEQTLQLRQASVESTLRFPKWIVRRAIGFELQTEVTAFHRRQDTPRFGEIKTTGATLAFSRTTNYPRIGDRQANARTFGVQYDFRSRERFVDSLRPIGADDDESQVPVTTRTGSIGVSYEWEQRVDRAGSLSPLAPEDGFRFEGRAAFASPYLLGQNTFIKLSAAGSRYWPIGTHMVLRADLRYDHGIPLGGPALLPEVERFFAGGDANVRGYDDDRLATEVIQVGVPPLSNVTQIRILPAGGNIRTMASLDGQVRIKNVLYTAVFADAGLITNQWSAVRLDDIRPSIGMALLRIVTPFGSFAFERAVPLRPRLGDDPRGRWHISFAARAQF